MHQFVFVAQVQLGCIVTDRPLGFRPKRPEHRPAPRRHIRRPDWPLPLRMVALKYAHSLLQKRQHEFDPRRQLAIGPADLLLVLEVGHIAQAAHDYVGLEFAHTPRSALHRSRPGYWGRARMRHVPGRSGRLCRRAAFGRRIVHGDDYLVEQDAGTHGNVDVSVVDGIKGSRIECTLSCVEPFRSPIRQNRANTRFPTISPRGVRRTRRCIDRQQSVAAGRSTSVQRHRSTSGRATQ